MKVIVDTSVWIDFVNGHECPEVEALKRLIADEEDVVTCGLVAAEFLQGLKRPRDFQRLQALFLDLSWITPIEPDTYLAAAALFRGLRRKGITIRSTSDTLLLRLAEENACYLLARDRDLTQALGSGLVKVDALPLRMA